MFPISDPEHPRHGIPYVNVGIMALCILVFLYQVLLLDDYQLSSFYNNYGVLPYELTGQGDLGEQVNALLEEGDRSVLEVEGVSTTPSPAAGINPSASRTICGIGAMSAIS